MGGILAAMPEAGLEKVPTRLQRRIDEPHDITQFKTETRLLIPMKSCTRPDSHDVCGDDERGVALQRIEVKLARRRPEK